MIEKRRLAGTEVAGERDDRDTRGTGDTRPVGHVASLPSSSAFQQRPAAEVSATPSVLVPVTEDGVANELIDATDIDSPAELDLDVAGARPQFNLEH